MDRGYLLKKKKKYNKISISLPILPYFRHQQASPNGASRLFFLSHRLRRSAMLRINKLPSRLLLTPSQKSSSLRSKQLVSRQLAQQATLLCSSFPAYGIKK